MPKPRKNVIAVSLDSDKSSAEQAKQAEKPSVKQVDEGSSEQEILPKVEKQVEKPKNVRGKRGSNEYKQINAFISKDLHKEIRHILIDKDQDLSSIVEELLQTWVLKHKISK